MRSKEKIKKIRERALIREYVNLRVLNALLEQDYYGDYGDVGSMMGGSTEPGPLSPNITAFLTKSDFARLFGFDSIKNTVDTAVYGLRSVATTALGERKIFWKSLLWTIVPFIKSDKYDNILEMADDDREKIENKLEKLDSKYSEVIKKNEEIFHNADINFAFFLAAPGAVVATEIVDKSLTAASNIFDDLVGKDNQKESYSKNTDALLKSIMPGFGLNPENPQDLKRIHQSIFKELKQQFPDLSEGELNSIIGQVLNENLREQQVVPPTPVAPPVDPLTLKIKQFLETKEGNVWVDKIRNNINGLKAYLSSAVAQQKMNNSPMVKSGQQILATEIVDAAVKALSKFDMNYLKTNFKSEIDKFMDSKNIKDPAEREKLINDPEASKEVTETLRNIIKKPYIAQLDELQKLNPSALKGIVEQAKKQIEAIASGRS